MTVPTFPGYRNVSQLGSGGFADVFRAQREGPLGRWVAIKLFRVALHDTAAAAQFRDECSAIMRLDGQPDVLTVHDAAVHPDGRPYLVMELCGDSLLQLLGQRGRPLPADEVATIGHRIATALDAAHFARVLHGDVTPQNVLFRQSGGPVLADFGLAVLRDHRGNTAAGFNPAHAAPETVRHDGAIDERSDVYGLGSTLFTALTGQPPFPLRMGETDAARAMRVLSEPPPRAVGAPGWLADLLDTMLAKDASARPSAAQVAAALPGGGAAPPVIGSGPSFAPPPGMPAYAPPPGIPAYAPPAGVAPASQAHTRDRASAPSGPAGPTDEPDHTRLRADRPSGPGPEADAAPSRWRRPIVIGVVALLLVAAGVGAVVVFGPRPDSPAEPVAQPPAAAPGEALPVAIDLAVPQDDGTTVTLTWTADAALDYGVIVAAEGAEPQVLLADRATSLTVPVEPGTQYCFRVQGTDGRNGVAESNVQSVRGAVCRF